MTTRVAAGVAQSKPSLIPRSTYSVVIEASGPLGAELCTVLLADPPRLVCDVVAVASGSSLEKLGVRPSTNNP